MTRHFVTLFDSKYLPQGLALYESLMKHSSETFVLHILPMDEGCGEILSQLKLQHVQILWLDRFISEMKLKEAKRTRTVAEFCWTCASNLCKWLARYAITEVTYLDADMMFFSDPKVIFDEIGNRSIAVVPHRLIPSKKHLEVNGKYNVSWVTFKNTPNGRECLSTWAAQCRERCSAQVGCGDQKYLDEFEKYGDDLCVIQNIGAGLAPWNLANYKLTEGPKVDGQDVVFYHYHEFQATAMSDRTTAYRLTNYELRPEDTDFIYKPYMAAYARARESIVSIHIQA